MSKPNFVFPFAVDGRLQCFQSGVIMNRPALTICIQPVLWTHFEHVFISPGSILWEQNYWMTWQGCVSLFKKTANWFSKMIFPFYVLTSNALSSNCALSLPTCNVVSLFTFSHSRGSVVASHRGFNVHFTVPVSCVFLSIYLLLWSILLYLLPI